MQRTTTWSAGQLIGVFDHDRAAWVSLTSPVDRGAAEFQLTPHEFPDFDTADARWLGDVVVEVENLERDGSWSAHSSSLREHRRVIEDADTITVEHGPDPQANGLLFRQRYLVDATGDGLVWRTEIRNSTQQPVTLVRVGIPLLMNQYFRNDQQFKYERCVLRHSAIIHANSWFYWAKSSGAGPILGLKALNDTVLQAFSVDRSNGLWGSRSSFESAFEGTYTAYAIHPRTAEFPACTGPRALAPGETMTLEFVMSMQPDLDQLHDWLANHGGFYLRADPGMVTPIATEAKLRVRASTEPSITAVDDADQVGPLTRCSDREWEVPVHLGGCGRRVLKVGMNGQTSRIEMWGIEPPEAIFTQQAEFIAANQWETDDNDPAYHGLLQWDLESARRINTSHNPGLPRWMEGGSDEIGLVSGLYLSEWNVYRPDDEQIRVLQHYCRDFIEDRLTEQPGWRLHRAVPWFTMFDPWTGRGVDDIWRAFNYVHVVNTYYNMYRIADRYSFDWLEDKKTWLAKAFHYTEAMFTFWMFPDGVGATDYGNMGETVIATELAGALRSEGMNHEAALVEGWVGRKALYLASKPFPFGSEMAYDSTAFEAVYAYGKSIGDTELMRRSIAATLGNRGVQPVWYLYMTDVRGGGDSRWNVSYMTQLGAVSLADWLLEQGNDDLAIARAMFGSFLAGFSIFNSGGYLSSDERNRGAAGWIAVGEKGELTGNDGQPHLKGIVGLSGEGALGFYGALRAAMSVVCQEAGQWRALGGDLTETSADGTYRFVPNDGLRTRFLDITQGSALKLERDALRTIRRTDTGLELTIDNITGDAHELRLWIRLPEPDEYTISTGAQGTSVEQELGGTRWSQLTLNLPALPRVRVRITQRWQSLIPGGER